jgi:protein-tyrosine phosphatase
MADILIVCTGNICRSPMAEGFLRRSLEARFSASAPSVGSAGTWGSPGNPAMPEAVAAAAERGADIRSHGASTLDPDSILPASVILGMTQEHRDTSAQMVGGSGSRTFTLKELVRLLEGLEGAGGTVAEAPVEQLRARVAAADVLRAKGFVGNPLDEDVVDPLGTPMETYRAVAWEIDSLCERLVDGLYGAVDEARAAGGGTP